MNEVWLFKALLNASPDSFIIRKNQIMFAIVVTATLLFSITSARLLFDMHNQPTSKSIS